MIISLIPVILMILVTLRVTETEREATRKERLQGKPGAYTLRLLPRNIQRKENSKVLRNISNLSQSRLIIQANTPIKNL